MIWTDFLAQVRRELEESAASIYSDTSILNWTNEAARDIATKTRLMVDEIYANSVADQRSYDLEDYTLDVVGVLYAGDPLSKETAEAFRSYADDAITETGTPLYYSWFGSPPALYLRPIPSEAQQMRVFRHRYPDPIASVSSTASMPFESKYDRVIADYIKARSYEQTGEWDASDRFNARYMSGIGEVAQDVSLAESSDAASSAPVERF